MQTARSDIHFSGHGATPHMAFLGDWDSGSSRTDLLHNHIHPKYLEVPLVLSLSRQVSSWSFVCVVSLMLVWASVGKPPRLAATSCWPKRVETLGRPAQACVSLVGCGASKRCYCSFTQNFVWTLPLTWPCSIFFLLVISLFSPTIRPLLHFYFNPHLTLFLFLLSPPTKRPHSLH